METLDFSTPNNAKRRVSTRNDLRKRAGDDDINKHFFEYAFRKGEVKLVRLRADAIQASPGHEKAGVGGEESPLGVSGSQPV